MIRITQKNFSSFSKIILDNKLHRRNGFSMKNWCLESFETRYGHPIFRFKLIGILYREEIPIGSCCVGRYQWSAINHVGVFISRDFRRLGLGSKLLQRCLRCVKIPVEYFSDTRSTFRFYLANGLNKGEEVDYSSRLHSKESLHSC